MRRISPRSVLPPHSLHAQEQTKLPGAATTFILTWHLLRNDLVSCRLRPVILSNFNICCHLKYWVHFGFRCRDPPCSHSQDDRSFSDCSLPPLVCDLQL